MKKAIGYVRISDKDQSNWSLEGQEKDIRRHCDQKAVELLTVFKDDGQSAKNFDRAEWKTLEAFISKHHKEIDSLLVVAYDRFSRNISEALAMIERLEKQFTIQIISITQPIALHRHSPYFFDFRAQMLLRADVELRVIRDRTKNGMVRGAREGRFLNVAPVGYTNARDAQDRPIIVVNEEKAPLIRRVYQLFLEGMPLKEIHRTVKELKLQGNSAIQRILTNPVYGGLIKVPAFYDDPEELVKGQHQAIVDETTWWRVQGMLNKPQPKIIYNEEVPLRTVLKHRCGKSLTAGNSKGKKNYYWYYVCQSCKKSLPAKQLHAQFEEILQHLNFSKQDLERISTAYAAALKKKVGDSTRELDTRRRDLREVEGKLESLEEKYIGNDIDAETYKKWRIRYQNDRLRLQGEITALSVPVKSVWEKFSANMAMLADLSQLYHKSNIHQKQAFVRLVFDSQLYYDEGIYRTPYILPVFRSKALILKEKRLLEIEQPLQISGATPVRAPGGT